MLNRRKFINYTGLGFVGIILNGTDPQLYAANMKGKIMTVKGMIGSAKLGFTLTHEHILVDFSGAEDYDPSQWNDDEVIRVVTPYIEEIRNYGCNTLIDCTPEYIGRDPELLLKLSQLTGLNIITNTGLYGAADNKYIPEYAYSESAEQLSERWIREFEKGIEDTGIRPGFMKIGVAPESLSEFHKKLVTAAAITHLKTGLTITSHTGPAIPAFEELEILKENGVHPEAFIWIHAQNEKDDQIRIQAAKMGAWVSLDGLDEYNVDQYCSWLKQFRDNDLLQKVLISHDAGWYTPGEENGGEFRSYTTVFERLIPRLKEKGFANKEINRIFVNNPIAAFSIKIRKL